jgi:serine/threonine protein kinase
VKPTDHPDSVPRAEAATLVRENRSPLAATIAARPFGFVDPEPPTDDGETFAARYQMREKLGEGGMGEVHLVLDRRIGREVALKAVHPEHVARADLHARFVREARVQGQLEHPSIVPVYELSLGHEPAYFTMRRVRGVTLEQVVKAIHSGDADATARFSSRKLLTAFDNVCLAVDFAHAHGVVHRDLKPSNVMLGDFGEVHVLDWGVAKVGHTADAPEAIKVDAGDLTPKTEAGAFMGTLGYVAPEQLRGETVTPQADVYALGAILFEILTLAPLHAGARTSEIAQSTLQGVDARPSVRAPDCEVAPELEAICVKATALDPAKRFLTAREIHDAIEHFLDGNRDVEQRRELARGHAKAALEAAARATAPTSTSPDADRTLALKEAARALALDPTNTEAMQATLRLRAQPPKHFPEEVERQLAESNEALMRSGAAFGTIVFAFILATLPLVLWMGVKDSTFVLETAGLYVVSIVILFARSRRARMRQVPPLVLASMLGWVLTTRIAGPFVLLPALVAGNTMAYAVLDTRRSRWLALAVGCAAVVVPTILEWTGTFGPSYAFHDGAITIVPGVLSFPRTPTFVFLTLTSLGCVLVPFLFVARLRAALYDLQRKMTLQAWQFRQLVPEQMHEAAGAAPLEPFGRPKLVTSSGGPV